MASPRDVGAEDDAARAPCGFVKTAGLDDEVAFLLAGAGEFRPCADGFAVERGSVEDGAGGELDGLHYPCARDDAQEGGVEVGGEIFAPVFMECGVVEEGEVEFFLLIGLHGGGEGDMAGFDGVEECVGALDVAEIEKLKEPVNDVHARRDAVERDCEGVAERHEVGGMGAVDAVALCAQGLGEPFKFGAVGGGFVADDNGDEWLGCVRGEGGDALVKEVGLGVAANEGRAAGGGVVLVEVCGEADAARDAIHFGEREAGAGDEEVGTEDARDLVFDGGVASVGDETVGLAAVKIGGDPREECVGVAEDFFPLGGAVVETFLGLQEGVAGVADLVDFVELRGRERERDGGGLPGFVGEERQDRVGGSVGHEGAGGWRCGGVRSCYCQWVLCLRVGEPGVVTGKPGCVEWARRNW